MAKKISKENVEKVEPTKEQDKLTINVPEREVSMKQKKMKPTEWAIQFNVDPSLFNYWENQLLTEEEFKNLKEERGV